jgi:periplasmic protein TonB
MSRRALAGVRHCEPGPLSERAPQPHQSTRQPASRRLIVTVVVSLGLHAAALIVVLFLLHAGVPAVATVDKPTEVELVMEEHKGDLRPTARPSPSAPKPATQQPPVPQPDPSASAAAVKEPEAPQPNAPEQTAASIPPTQAPGETPKQAAKPEQPAPVEEAKRESVPAPPAAQTAPVISLQGTDSPSDARAFGDRVIPARPDAVFHNRPPEYPIEAGLSGQEGVVKVVIHVSPAGTAVGVDLVSSSGYVLLDRAAEDAVMRWRFMPAVKDGRPVASDMGIMFTFGLDR